MVILTFDEELTRWTMDNAQGVPEVRGELWDNEVKVLPCRWRQYVSLVSNGVSCRSTGRVKRVSIGCRHTVDSCENSECYSCL
ncbi:hypothetical protein D3C72_2418310 [compost metagenome]